jgi:hypothetical protein
MPTVKPNSDKSDKSDKSDNPRKYQRPPRRKNRFNEREVARAGRAARAIGAERVEVDPATGKISIYLPTGKSVAGNDLDQWMKDRNARAPERHS